MTAVEALVNLFFIHEKSAFQEQVETDAILDGKKDVSDSNDQSSQSSGPAKSKGDEIEETVAKRKIFFYNVLLTKRAYYIKLNLFFQSCKRPATTWSIHSSELTSLF